MTQMHGKKLFTGIENVKGFFIFDIAPVYEIEHPFRICKHALFTRIWKNKALVLGWWTRSSGMEKTLLLSLRGRIINAEKEELREYNRPEFI